MSLFYLNIFIFRQYYILLKQNSTSNCILLKSNLDTFCDRVKCVNITLSIEKCQIIFFYRCRSPLSHSYSLVHLLNLLLKTGISLTFILFFFTTILVPRSVEPSMSWNSSNVILSISLLKFLSLYPLFLLSSVRLKQNGVAIWYPNLYLARVHLYA